MNGGGLIEDRKNFDHVELFRETILRDGEYQFLIGRSRGELDSEPRVGLEETDLSDMSSGARVSGSLKRKRSSVAT